MKRLIIVLLLALPGMVMAAAGGGTAYTFDPDLGNEASLQRGAATFMNYCSGCHSMGLLRYNRLAEDLGIPEDLLKANLMFTSDKVGDQIHTSMIPAAEGWFGKMPPDLTLTARARGDDWVYSFLKTFYVDASRPNGVNNLTLEGASMPHVLGGLQGWQAVRHDDEEHAEASGHGSSAPDFEMIEEGTLSAKEYDRLVSDLTNFMVYAAEPIRLKRTELGAKVILFLIIFTFLAYLLKREFWKDVH